MTRRIPWRHASSDAEPELRALVRYARESGPSPDELAALTARVSAQLARERPDAVALPASSASVGATSRVRSVRAFVLASAILLGLLAWQGRHESAGPSPRVTPHRAPHEAERATPRPSVSAPPAELAPAVSAHQPAIESAPKPSEARVAPRRSTRKLPTTPVTGESARPEDELALLFRVRRIVVADPGRALELTQEHTNRFPHGLFAEEREALQIEALVRSGRTSEAAEQYASFSQRHGRSAYHERLTALLRATDAGSSP